MAARKLQRAAGAAKRAATGAARGLRNAAREAYAFYIDHDGPERVRGAATWAGRKYADICDTIYYDPAGAWDTAKRWSVRAIFPLAVALGLYVFYGPVHNTRTFPETKQSTKLEWKAEKSDKKTDIAEINEADKSAQADKTRSRYSNTTRFEPSKDETNLEMLIKKAFRGKHDLGFALCEIESGFQTFALSKVYCAGLYQLSVDAANEVAPELGGAKKGYFQINYPMTVDGKTFTIERPCKDPRKDWRFDPRKNTFGGAEYLEGLTRKYRDQNTALAAYNWGPNNVDNIIKQLRNDGIKRPKFFDEKQDNIYNHLPTEVKEFIINVKGTESMYNMKFPISRMKGISSGYGWRDNPNGPGKEFHEGYDISAEKGTPALSIAKGKVIFAGYQDGYGNTVVVKHDNSPFYSQYSHLDKIKVEEGDEIGRGRTIGKVGSTGESTGPHLDLRVFIESKDKKKTVDWMKYADRIIPEYELRFDK